MNFTKIGICLASLFLTSLGAAKAQDPFANGLVAFYPFNGNAIDQSGNGNHATPAGNYQYLADGLSGGAIRIIGDNSQYYAGGGHVILPAFTSNLNSGFTCSLWVKNEVIGSGPVDAETIIGFYNNPQEVSAFTTRMALVNREPVYVGFFNGNGSGIAVDHQHAVDLVTHAGQWKHLVITSGPGHFGCYKDGVKLYETNIAYSVFPAAAAALGRQWWNGGSSARMSATFDNVRIYNRVLSASEIQQLHAYEGGFCSPHKATATAQLVNGFVVGATITDGGCGYTNVPLVLIQGGGGSGATATAVVNNGVVIGITILSAGSGYATNPPPKIVIASPPFEPSVGIAFSRVNVTQRVVLGRNYVLEASTNLVIWVATGPSFFAASETYTNEFVIGETGGFFRLREVP